MGETTEHTKELRKILRELRQLELRIQLLEKRVSAFELCLVQFTEALS